MRADRQLMFDVAGIGSKCRLDTAEQLLRIRECILQRMPDQIGIAQSEKMFCRRIEVGDPRLVIQQYY